MLLNTTRGRSVLYTVTRHRAMLPQICAEPKRRDACVALTLGTSAMQQISSRFQACSKEIPCRTGLHRMVGKCCYTPVLRALVTKLYVTLAGRRHGTQRKDHTHV